MRRHPHEHHRSILFRTLRISQSANVLFFACCLVVLGLFVLGNYQEFLDRSQQMLLTMVFFLGLLCAATGLFTLVSLLIWMVRRRHALVFRFLFTIVSSAVGAACALGIGVLQALVQAT